jgi:hypothetical protein
LEDNSTVPSIVTKYLGTTNKIVENYGYLVTKEIKDEGPSEKNVCVELKKINLNFI